MELSEVAAANEAVALELWGRLSKLRVLSSSKLISTSARILLEKGRCIPAGWCRRFHKGTGCEGLGRTLKPPAGREAPSGLWAPRVELQTMSQHQVPHCERGNWPLSQAGREINTNTLAGDTHRPFIPEDQITDPGVAEEALVSPEFKSGREDRGSHRN